MREAERSTRSLKGGRGRTESRTRGTAHPPRGSEAPSVLLTGPFGGLTDDVREFLRCLADEGLPLTGWGDLDQASLRTVRERLPGGGAGGDGPDGPGPGQAADQPAAVAVRRRPAHR